MSDDTQEMDPGSPGNSQLAPWLADFREQAGAGPLDDAIVGIQQHINQRTVADENAAEGNALVNNMASIKGGLVDLVTKDPTATDAALNFAHQAVGAAVDHAGVPEDARDDTHSALAGDIQQSIAHAAVQRMAEISKPGAMSMLDKYGDHFSEDDRGAVSHYIDAMDAARGIDKDAQLAQAAGQQRAQSQANAFTYAQALLDPHTETVRFPDGWMQSVIKDTGVSPADKSALFDTFKTLRTTGDAEQSDAFLVHDLLRGMSSAVDPATRETVMANAGKSLRFADAQMLHGMALRNSPDATAEVSNLTSTIGQVRELMTGKSGVENGAAGAAAFQRYMNWLLPAYRQIGAEGLNPASPSYLLQHATPATYAPVAADLPRGSGARTRSLGDIFGDR